MNILPQAYEVGPLLYCPAANPTISNSIIQEKFGKNFSLTLCLEDTIDDNRVEDAEEILVRTLNTIFSAKQDYDFYLPKLFIRVRNPHQIPNLYKRLGEVSSLLTGFIMPKFTPENADEYIEEIKRINEVSAYTIYMMPIIEDPYIIDLRYRYGFLYELKDKLDVVSDFVLNVRVGGNDLCHAFGFRRQSTECIHDILPIAEIFSDVIAVFGRDYVVSGPVWEYYDGQHWKEGLEYELDRDRLSGFVGKTVIHPNQIPSVNKAYMVKRSDYEDACAILDWNKDTPLLVSGSIDKSRMNERKTHSNWAEKILALARVYGILDNM